MLANYTVTAGKEAATNYGGGRHARLVSFAGRDGDVRWSTRA